jgi:hypothetical protein
VFCNVGIVLTGCVMFAWMSVFVAVGIPHRTAATKIHTYTSIAPHVSTIPTLRNTPPPPPSDDFQPFDS